MHARMLPEELWQCVWKRAATLPLMSLCVAETERLMHSGSSPLAATGLPRATADDSFNCFQSFRLVPAQWRRVLAHVCVGLCACDMVFLCACAHVECLHPTVIVCGCCTHMWSLMNVFAQYERKIKRELRPWSDTSDSHFCRRKLGRTYVYLTVFVRARTIKATRPG